MTPIRKRFRIAMAIYLVIGASAWFTLDGQLRWIVLVVLAALGAKTWVALRREELP